MNLLECSEGLICFLRWSPMVELDRGSFPASFAPMLPLALAFLRFLAGATATLQGSYTGSDLKSITLSSCRCCCYCTRRCFATQSWWLDNGLCSVLREKKPQTTSIWAMKGPLFPQREISCAAWKHSIRRKKFFSTQCTKGLISTAPFIRKNRICGHERVSNAWRFFDLVELLCEDADDDSFCSTAASDPLLTC